MAAGRLKKEKLSDVHLYNEDDENTTFLENESDGAHGVVTPLPKKKIITLFILLFANAAVSTSPFPFLPFMVQDLGVAPQNAGTYVGIIAGGRFLGNMAFNWLWGILADKYGRRPTILASVFMQVVCTIFFAISTRWSIVPWVHVLIVSPSASVGLATFARFLGGATNGAVPIAKTYVSEITDHTNQGQAMTLITASWGVGLVIGPALGGYLSDPAAKYSQFAGIRFFEEYKYALPMFVVALLCIIASVLGVLYLQESLPAKSLDEPGRTPSTASASNPPSSLRSTSGTMSTSGWRRYFPPLLHDSTRLTAVVLYSVLSIQAIGFDELYNVFCATPKALGGLGYSTNEIGFTLIVFGLVQSLSTALIYPKLEKRFGICPLFRYCAICTAVFFVWFPLIPTVMWTVSFYIPGVDAATLTWVALISTTALSRITNSICFVASAIFINNSVEASQRGALNGLGMTVASGVRSLTPITFGAMYSWSISSVHRLWPFDKSMAFVCFAGIMLHVAHISLSLPKSISRQITD